MALLVGVIGTGVLFGWSLEREATEIQDDLARRSQSLGSAIRAETDRRVQFLRALGSFVQVRQGARRSSLHAYITELTRGESESTILDWVEVVPFAELRTYEERQWLQGLPDFHVHRAGGPPPRQEEYLPLHLGLAGGARVEGANLTAGSDLSSAPVFASALAFARARRDVTAAEPVRVVRPDTTELALPMVFPVRAFGPDDPAALDVPAGFALGIFDIDSLITHALTESDRRAVGIALRDDGQDAQAGPLFLQRTMRGESASVKLALWNAVRGGEFRERHGFDVAGRSWSLELTSGSLLVAQHVTWFPWVIAVVGVLFSATLATAVNTYTTRNAGMAAVRRRLSKERREYMQKVGQLTEDLDRERLDRRRTEESLFREKQQFRLMFNAVPAMICYKDTKNRFLLVNEAAAAAMGHEVEDLEGRPCSEIVPGRAYELYRDDLEIIQTGKPKLGIVEKEESTSGEVTWTRTDKLPEYDAMGRVVGILVFSQDITDHRQAEAEIRRLNEELEQRVGARTAELRAANEELESFAYSVSHDLRTPLRTIDGFSKLVFEEFGDELPQAAREYLGRLRTAAQRMSQSIDDLLQLTRLSRQQLRLQKVDLSLLVREAVEKQRMRDPDRRVDVVVEATPFATGDPVLLANAVENLVDNAWKFTRRADEPRIEFGSRTIDGDRTAYYVRDNGVGFDMVYAEKLFGAFQRLHSQEDFDGSGIGLATVQLIIRRHAGEIWAEGTPDHGATFSFTLGT